MSVFKHCHGCGGEFQSWVIECPDCHVPLQLAPGETLAPETRPVAPIEDLVLLKVGEPWELRELAETLQEHGVSCEIDAYPRGGSIARAGARKEPARLGIYVARADIDTVRSFAAHVAELESESGAEVEAHDPGQCPACGEPTRENAPSCASCGLEFPEAPAD